MDELEFVFFPRHVLSSQLNFIEADTREDTKTINKHSFSAGSVEDIRALKDPFDESDTKTINKHLRSAESIEDIRALKDPFDESDTKTINKHLRSAESSNEINELPDSADKEVQCFAGTFSISSENYSVEELNMRFEDLHTSSVNGDASVMGSADASSPPSYTRQASNDSVLDALAEAARRQDQQMIKMEQTLAELKEMIEADRKERKNEEEKRKATRERSGEEPDEDDDEEEVWTRKCRLAQNQLAELSRFIDELVREKESLEDKLKRVYTISKGGAKTSGYQENRHNHMASSANRNEPQNHVSVPEHLQRDPSAPLLPPPGSYGPPPGHIQTYPPAMVPGTPRFHIEQPIHLSQPVEHHLPGGPPPNLPGYPNSAYDFEGNGMAGGRYAAHYFPN